MDIQDINNRNAIRAARIFLSDLRYPDEILAWDPTVRLRKFLESERKKHSVSFFDFLKNHDEIVARMMARKNLSGGSIAEMERITALLIEERLSICGIDGKLQSQLRYLARGEKLSQSIYTDIIALQVFDSEKIQKASAVAEKSGFSEIITIAIGELDKRHRGILSRRYGLKTNQGQTLNEIGIDYNLTRERIRQLENKSKRKISTQRRIKALIAALRQENMLDRLFQNQKIIQKHQIYLIGKTLTGMERLAIDLAYGKISNFLDSEAVRIKTGWVRKQDLDLANDKTGFSESLRHRVLANILRQDLPVCLSEIISDIPDYQDSLIKNMLVQKMGASFDGDTITAIPDLPISVQCIMAIRDAGRAMNCSEVQASINDIFKGDKTVRRIQQTLQTIPEIMIIKRGTYDLFANLEITRNDLMKVRNRTVNHLKKIGGFVSVKVLFEQLFAEKKGRFYSGFQFLYVAWNSKG